MKTGFEYYAFISYKREDEKLAKWLQNKLETYKLPISLAKETEKEFPKNFHPCFRDKTDLSETGDLSKILHDKLQKSQYLIVVCSPRSAQSKWVNKEVKTFQKMGRADKIIPFIIEGNPDTLNPNTHCYPSTLDENILGISIPELGKEKAVIKTIAAMLNINFDALWNRHRKRVWEKRIQITIISVIFIAFFCGFSIWQYLRIIEKNKALEHSNSTVDALSYYDDNKNSNIEIKSILGEHMPSGIFSKNPHFKDHAEHTIKAICNANGLSYEELKYRVELTYWKKGYDGNIHTIISNRNQDIERNFSFSIDRKSILGNAFLHPDNFILFLKKGESIEVTTIVKDESEFRDKTLEKEIKSTMPDRWEDSAIIAYCLKDETENESGSNEEVTCVCLNTMYENVSFMDKKITRAILRKSLQEVHLYPKKLFFNAE